MNIRGPWGDLGTCSECKKLFGQHPSSTGLSLVPTRIVKTGYLPKKLSKCEKRQTNGYMMRFIVNLNQRNALQQFGIILPLILPIPLVTETTEMRIRECFLTVQILVPDTHTRHSHILQQKQSNFTGK